MQQSSAEAAALLREAGATGCTDVTGFGLIGHLGEMTQASQASHDKSPLGMLYWGRGVTWLRKHAHSITI